MIQLLIIADDFTGALDTGVQFARTGTPTKVITDYEQMMSSELPACDVLVINTETRHLAPDQAFEKVSRLINDVKGKDIAYIYKNTDSVLRGNIGAELSALYCSGVEKSIAFIPAYPQMNRITAGGIQFTDGVPVAQSVFGKDPFNPVIHSDVSGVIHEQADIPVTNAAVPGADGPAEGIAVYDVASEEDLTV